jgi:DNA-binding FrmR family transcriptional regulator
MTMKFTYAAGARPVQGYTIRLGLGRGGFGEVYRAVSDGGKDVALKLVQQHLDVERRGVGQCMNLKHPHLVVVYDILQGENEDTWIVMEYVAGVSLEQVLARHPQGIPEPQALGWLHGICSGVRYLHEHGIVHRDLKPGNLFIENGVVKIGDYGLSKFISASRRSGQTMNIGSIHYMAPEMAQGRYGKEVDQYALGVILCEMLTGRVPFDGECQGEILMKHLTADPDLGRLTEPYRSVVARLLAKDPRNRYPAVQDLLAELPALDPAFPGSVAAGSPWQQAQSETEIHAAAPDLSPAESELANPCSDEAAGGEAERPAAEQPGPGGAKKPRFAKGPLIRLLAENGMEVSDIRRLIRALRQYPGQELPSLVTTVPSMVEHSWDAKGVEHLVRVLARRPELDVPCILAVLQTLVEHDFDAREIERVLSVLGEHPERGLAGEVAAVQDMAEHGVDAKDIVRVLRALGAYPKQNLPGLVTAVQGMIEHDLDASDVERVLRALGEYPTQDLAGKVAAVRSLAEHGVDAKDIVRVLRALGACSKHELAAKLATVQRMVEHDVDAKDIERILRALGACSAQAFTGAASVVESLVENGVDAKDIERVLRAVGEYPELELAGVIAAVQRMVEDGMEAEDIEKSVRARAEYAG